MRRCTYTLDTQRPCCPYFTIILELDTYAEVNLDTLAPVFALGPSLQEKPNALSPVLALGLVLTAFDSNSPVPVHVPLPWGLKHYPLGPSITATANPGSTLSSSSNPVPAAAPTSLAPPGPAKWVATT